MAVAIDIGEWNDIHPLNKKDVGSRLALTARHVTYGDNKIVHSGPVYKSMKIKGNRIILVFANTGSGVMMLSFRSLYGMPGRVTRKMLIFITLSVCLLLRFGQMIFKEGSNVF